MYRNPVAPAEDPAPIEQKITAQEQERINKRNEKKKLQTTSELFQLFIKFVQEAMELLQKLFKAIFNRH